MLCLSGSFSPLAQWANKWVQVSNHNMRIYCANEIELQTTEISNIGQQIGWTAAGHYVFDHNGHVVEFCGSLNGRI